MRARDYHAIAGWQRNAVVVALSRRSLQWQLIATHLFLTVLFQLSQSIGVYCAILLPRIASLLCLVVSAWRIMQSLIWRC